MNCLITDDHFHFVLLQPLHIFPLNENKVEFSVIDLQLVSPLYNEIGPLGQHWLVDVDLQQVVAKFLLIFICENVKLIVEQRDCLDARNLIHLVNVNLILRGDVQPQNIVVCRYDSDFLTLIKCDVIWLGIQKVVQGYHHLFGLVYVVVQNDV